MELMSKTDLSLSKNLEFNNQVTSLIGERLSKISIPLNLVSSEPSHKGQDRHHDASPWLALLESGIPAPYVGSGILSFSEANPDTRAFVLFSLKDELILKILRHIVAVPGIRILYATRLELSRIGAVNLIELCYGHKPWMTDKIRERMARERVVSSNGAFIVLFSGWGTNFDQVQDLKAELRAILPTLTFERRVHGTDDPQDTRTLIEALTNPNSRELLNRVAFTRFDRVFKRIPSELRGNPDVCIDGSSVMELYGLRKSRDLDLICLGKDLRARIEDLGFDVNNDRFDSLPLSAAQIICNPYFHVRLFGTKFTSLSTRGLLLSFGASSELISWSPKKDRDFESISLFNAGKSKTRLSIKGAVGTFATQLRLGFEFIVIRVIPKLPPSLVKILRKVRSALAERSRV